MPSDLAASIWPRSMDRIPARTISVMYAPSLTPRATIPAWIVAGDREAGPIVEVGPACRSRSRPGRSRGTRSGRAAACRGRTRRRSRAISRIGANRDIRPSAAKTPRITPIDLADDRDRRRVSDDAAEDQAVRREDRPEEDVPVVVVATAERASRSPSARPAARRARVGRAAAWRRPCYLLSKSRCPTSTPYFCRICEVRAVVDHRRQRALDGRARAPGGPWRR